MTAAPPAASRTRVARRALARMPGGVRFAVAILVTLGLAALLAGVIRPLDPGSATLGSRMLAPSAQAPFGTDTVGRDLLALVLRGLRVSILTSAAAAVIAAVVGGAIGAFAATMGGKVDAVTMRLVDVFAAQNHFLFGLLLVVLSRPVLGPVVAVTVSVAVTHWVATARIVRSEILSLRSRPFVLAAVNSGASRRSVAVNHLLPHVLQALGLTFVLLVPHAIFHESGYSFLGLGMPATSPSLGNLVADSQRGLLLGGWWMAVFPGAVLFLLCAAVGTVGVWCRDRLDPRSRSELEL